MGVSTDAQIYFGVQFEEGYEFPWDSEDHDEIDEWWREKNGFQPSTPIYDKKGDYLNGVTPTDEQWKTYFAEREAFDAEHPLPVGLVTHCSGEYPMYALAVPESVIEANRGNLQTFAPVDLAVPREAEDALLAFCKDNELEPLGDPQWWLSSYWG